LRVNFFSQFLVDIPHIFADPDPGSQNLANPNGSEASTEKKTVTKTINNSHRWLVDI